MSSVIPVSFALLSASFSQKHPVIYAVIVALLMLLLWRLWRFSIVPVLYPHDPKDLPYWIPCEQEPSASINTRLKSTINPRYGSMKVLQKSNLLT